MKSFSLHSHKSFDAAPNFLKLVEIVADACKKDGNDVLNPKQYLKYWIYNEFMDHFAGKSYATHGTSC